MSTRTLSVAASLLAAVLYLALLGQTTYANAFLIVDMTDDVAGATACTDAPGDCSLRGAVLHANASTDSDTIIVPAGAYALSLAGQDTDSSTGSLRVMGGYVTVRGAGPDASIVDADLIDDGAFIVQDEATAIFSGMTLRNGNGGGAGIDNNYSNVTVRDLALIGGDATGSGGGGMYISGGKTVIQRSTLVKDTADSGAAVFIDGQQPEVTITDTTISANIAGFWGGAIASFADNPHIFISTSTLSAGNAQLGGAIYNASTGDGSSAGFFVSESTISGNSADEGAQPNGHAVYQDSTLSLDLSNVTVANNSGPAGTAAVYIAPGTSTVFLSRIVFADNGPATCAGQSTTSIGGLNMASDDTCDLGQDGLSNQVLMLGTLSDNGGPTFTHLPQPGSPAIDADHGCDPDLVDQRGIRAPIGAGCDVGSVEAGLPDDQTTLEWGNANCLDGINLDDVIVILETRQIDEVNDGCPQYGDYAFVGDWFPAALWADLDCNKKINGIDALLALAFVGQFDPGVSPAGPCPEVGQEVQLGG